jgi:hypothetical protein
LRRSDRARASRHSNSRPRCRAVRDQREVSRPTCQRMIVQQSGRARGRVQRAIAKAAPACHAEITRLRSSKKKGYRSYTSTRATPTVSPKPRTIAV